MTEIYVDADACPVKDEIVRVAERHGLVVHMVANQWMRLSDSPLVRRVVVDDGFDAADDWIASRAGAADIAITADIPLAARCLEKGAAVLGPTGRPFDRAGIGMAMAMRDLNAHLRDTGEIRGGGPAFGKQDRSRFLQALENTVQAIRRRPAGR
ncbi:MAG: YaiI/YqxD family protein [Inquilinus sp.]|nr:YaiI/YqxD family protein [Inquilinus sp.]